MIIYAGFDPSQSSPAMADMDNKGKLGEYSVKADAVFDARLKELAESGADIRLTIERPPLAIVRLASAHFCANQYKKRFMELVPSIQVQFVVPVAWQSKMLQANHKMKRDQRKRLSLIRAESFGFRPDKAKGSDDIADAINIADYGRLYLTWEDRIAGTPMSMDLSEIDLTDVEMSFA